MVASRVSNASRPAELLVGLITPLVSELTVSPSYSRLVVTDAVIEKVSSDIVESRTKAADSSEFDATGEYTSDDVPGKGTALERSGIEVECEGSDLTEVPPDVLACAEAVVALVPPASHGKPGPSAPCISRDEVRSGIADSVASETADVGMNDRLIVGCRAVVVPEEFSSCTACSKPSSATVVVKKAEIPPPLPLAVKIAVRC